VSSFYEQLRFAPVPVSDIRPTVRAMGHDPRHYSDPEKFNPDRYLDPQIVRPPVFGWGRR
jgi:cytochrome P450